MIKKTTCASCGKKMSSDDNFCPSCGEFSHQEDAKKSPSKAKREGVPEEKKKDVEKSKGPEWLGGWLVVVALGLFFFVGYNIQVLYGLVTIFQDGMFELFNDPVSEYYIDWFGRAILIEGVLAVILLSGVLWCLALFFKKHHRFPKVYIGLLFLNLIAMIIDYGITSTLQATGESLVLLRDMLEEIRGDITQAAVHFLIWSSYIRKSKRVKNTFTVKD